MKWLVLISVMLMALVKDTLACHGGGYGGRGGYKKDDGHYHGNDKGAILK